MATSMPAAPRQQPRRIVPAIPFALIRRPRVTRPITPEGASTGAVASPAAEPKQATGKPAADEAVNGPPTPQSRLSVTANGDDAEDVPSGQKPDPDVAPQQGVASEKEDNAPTNGSDSHLEAAVPVVPEVLNGGAADTSSSTSNADTTNSDPPVSERQQLPEKTSHPSVVNHELQAGNMGAVRDGVHQPSTLPPAAQEPGRDMLPATERLMRHPPGLGAPSTHPFVAEYPPPWAAAIPPAVQPPHGDLSHAPDFPHQRPYQLGAFQNAEVNHGAPMIGPAAAPNGLRSGSQSPVKSGSWQTRHSSIHDIQGPSMQNGIAPHDVFSKQHAPGAPAFPEPIRLAEYLCSQVGNPEFADFILQVHIQGAPAFTMPVHAVVVSRSRTISAAIRSASISHQKASSKLATLHTQNTYITPAALAEAVRVLYGGPLLDPNVFCHGLEPFSPHMDPSLSPSDAGNRMSRAISYAATAVFLAMLDMHERGLMLIKALLRWDTLEQALAFARDSRPLMYSILDFLVFSFPVDFTFYANARELKLAPRLPQSPLTQIRFGDVPTEDGPTPDYVSQTLSCILLSCPLPLLDMLFNQPRLLDRVGRHCVERSLLAVVEERERRREQALKNLSGKAWEHDSASYSKPLVENLFWQESIKKSSTHPSGYTVIQTNTRAHPYP
ncbi:hypothetical protein M011DRAFT_477478 [Sporormia fimetaria CBS 119925]|uniref:BTB domain-containing protein n=1 Tax=Sporormia fimetaria CBS 119925 TaxID=1340428 RepID=A0A6A6VBZ5_9PLEO|nr:hypothetical protein M011DRAFT_477478 [Sporormia fimetaria CBS 119925]